MENTDARGEIEGLQMRLKSSMEEIMLLRQDIVKQKKVRGLTLLGGEGASE